MEREALPGFWFQIWAQSSWKAPMMRLWTETGQDTGESKDDPMRLPGQEKRKKFSSRESCKRQEIILKLLCPRLCQCWRRKGINIDGRQTLWWVASGIQTNSCLVKTQWKSEGGFGNWKRRNQPLPQACKKGHMQEPNRQKNTFPQEQGSSRIHQNSKTSN